MVRWTRLSKEENIVWYFSRGYCDWYTMFFTKTPHTIYVEIFPYPKKWYVKWGLMLNQPWNIHNVEGFRCKMWLGITQFVLVNMNGAKGRLGEKIAVAFLYWLQSISLADLTFSFFNSQDLFGEPIFYMATPPQAAYWKIHSVTQTLGLQNFNFW